MRKELKNKINELIEKYKTIDLEEIETRYNFISVKSYKVKINDGNVFYRDKFIKNNGLGSSSSILPILENGNIVLAVEPRVFTETTVEISMPGGYIDEGETSIECARRELEEETGLISDDIKKVSEYYIDLGNSDHISNIFIAYNCKKIGNTKFDDDEFVELIEVTKDELYEMIDSGMIKNSSTIIAALKLKEKAI